MNTRSRHHIDCITISFIVICGLVAGVFHAANAQNNSPSFDLTTFLPGRIHATGSLWYVDFTDEAQRSRTLRLSRPEIEGFSQSMWEQLNSQGGTGMWLAIDDKESPPKNIRMINVAQGQVGVYRPAEVAVVADVVTRFDARFTLDRQKTLAILSAPREGQLPAPTAASPPPANPSASAAPSGSSDSKVATGVSVKFSRSSGHETSVAIYNDSAAPLVAYRLEIHAPGMGGQTGHVIWDACVSHVDAIQPGRFNSLYSGLNDYKAAGLEVVAAAALFADGTATGNQKFIAAIRGARAACTWPAGGGASGTDVAHTPEIEPGTRLCTEADLKGPFIEVGFSEVPVATESRNRGEHHYNFIAFNSAHQWQNLSTATMPASVAAMSNIFRAVAIQSGGPPDTFSVDAQGRLSLHRGTVLQYAFQCSVSVDSDDKHRSGDLNFVGYAYSNPSLLHESYRKWSGSGD